MTSMALTPRSTDRLSSMKAVRKGVFDPVARGLHLANIIQNHSTSSKVMSWLNSRLIHYGQISITGASDQTPYHAAIALQLLASGRINTKAIITSLYPLEEVNSALKVAADHSALKVVIKL